MRSITGSSGFISCAEISTAISLLAGDPGEQRDDLVAAAQVEVRERLVEQQQPRPADQRVGDQHALLLAAGELPTRGSAKSRASTASSISSISALRRARGQRDAEAVRVEAEADEVARAQRHVGVEQELLRHVADQRVAPPRTRRAGRRRSTRPALACLQAEDHPEERRLAGAVGADQPGELARARSRS